ncbi:MAG: class II aldolase/adducin family protein [Chloroflexota bacterium]|nr:class II aldolase/adducin family protein [Chloroflexota bacterium]MDE3193652.1 class II aldolase/adducin family protein [Chloroflexota bacterium]
MDQSDLRRDLALACRILAANGHGDNIFGHVSVRAPGQDRFWMKAQHLGLEEIGEDDLVLLDRAGSVLEGKRERHIEFPIHAEVFHARPDVRCVVHTHPPHSVALGARRMEIRPIGHEGALFWPPGVPLFEEFTDLVTTSEQGQRVARSLGPGLAVFLRNHGIVVAAASIAHATIAAITLEKAAMVQLLAQPTRETAVAYTPAEEAEVKRGRIWSDRAVQAQWRYFVRRLGPGA